MKRKLFTIWTVLLIALLAVTPVAAGGVSVKWGSGSIIADGSGFGFSSYRYVQVTLDAMGTAHVSCVSPGNGSVVPGQNPTLPVSASASDITLSDKNGKFPVYLEAEPDTSSLNPQTAGCPNGNWLVRVDWVDWTWAKLTVEDVDDTTFAPTGLILWVKEYTCTSTPDTVDCKAIK